MSIKVLFILLFIFIYIFINYWICVRGWQFFGRHIPFVRKIYWPLFWFLALSYFIERFLRDYMPVELGKVILYIGSFWLAFMVYFALTLTVLELFRLFNKRYRIFYSFDENPLGGIIATLAVIMLVSAVVYYGWWNARHPQVTQYNINIAKNAGNFDRLRIVMVSDIHLGTIIHNGRLVNLVNMINAQNPDIVLLPGDVVDEHPDPFVEQDMISTFRQITAKHGIYAVPGNHEYIGGKSEEIFKYLHKAGVETLRDQVIKISDSFYLAGEDDLYNKRTKADIARPEFLEEQNIDYAYPVILMRHQPLRRSQPFMTENIDLILSGHTHRGQLFPFNFITERMYKTDWGHIQEGNAHLIVSQGYGTWGPPIRVANTPEVVCIDIHFKGN